MILLKLFVFAYVDDPVTVNANLNMNKSVHSWFLQLGLVQED